MPRKSALLLSFLNLALKPLVGQTSVSSTQHVALPQRPLPADREAWQTYWQAQGQSWRTEPEIDEKRQEYLAKLRTISPDIEHGIYPFKDIKINRADVEWLLATHENGRGPVDWNDESQRNREGLDLRGAHLQYADLRGLPLAKMLGGLHRDEWQHSSLERCEAAAIQLERVDLRLAHLEGADLHYAHLERADLRSAHLEKADLTKIHFQQADLNSTHFEGADLSAAHLEGAYLGFANLKRAILKEAHLEDVDLYKANLAGAVLCSAFFDDATRLNEVVLGDKKSGFIFLVDVRWNDVNLAVVNWSTITMLGDEKVARQPNTTEGVVKSKEMRLDEYRAAVRANRQLAVILQAQGLNEQAARFAYRAQVLQRRVCWFEMVKPRTKLKQRALALGAWLFSWFLYLLAGYGYRLGRSFLAYFLIISLFMTLYHVLDPRLAWNEAFVVSMTAFHGRGFSPSTFTPGDPLLLASAAEAFVGLIIEVTFIATLTQRFFNR